jgi:hypothetical protein
MVCSRIVAGALGCSVKAKIEAHGRKNSLKNQ